MQVRSAALGSLLLLSALSCARSGVRRDFKPGPEEQARRLAEAEKKGTQAQRGFLRYLMASDAAGAETLFLQAAQSGDAHERALALCGLGELRDDRLDTLGAAQAWQEVLKSAPRDPLAELAALRLLDAEGDSGVLDEQIFAAAQQSGLTPRAALFLRDAAARASLRLGKDEAEAWQKMGTLQNFRVGGPYAALRLLDLRRPLALDTEAPATLDASRSLEFPDGDVGLDSEPAEGDLFYAASQVTAARGGDYLAWIEGPGAIEVRLDGRVILARVPYPKESPRAQAVPVKLGAGDHAVLVRWSRAEGGRFRISLGRRDSLPSDLESKAPPKLTGQRTEAPCGLGQNCLAAPAWSDDAGLRKFAEEALAQDGGDCFAAWLSARSALGDDRAIARAASERAVQVCFSGAPTLALRAQGLLHDPELPDRLGRAKALTDATAAVQREPGLLRVRLTAAALDRDQERYDDAGQELERAESFLRALSAQTGKPAAPGQALFALPARLLLARARLLDAQGNTAAARAQVALALQASPTRCDARQLLFDYAQRDGGVAERARLADELAPCNDGLGVQVRLLRERGDLEKAEVLLGQLAARRPAQPARLEALAEVQQARQEFAAAAESLRRASALSPRSVEPLRRLAGVLELSGKAKDANLVRAEALKLAPGDLSLRQTLARDAHQDLLGWADRDGLRIARGDAPRAPTRGASAVRLLDHGAVQVFADGGAVERVHTVARVLDKKGISRFGEAQIPPDAEILHLRTIKPDGRTLEPESIPEKEGISLPGLETGDAVEIDYLRGIAPRGPELPGLGLGAFFFRDEETPMGESTSEIRSALPFEVDAHHLDAEPVARVGDEYRWSHTARDVEPQTPEPHQPSENETMPWAQPGSGAGQKELVRSVADWLLLKARTSSSTEALAKSAQSAPRMTQRDLARAIIEQIAQAVRGNSNDLTTTAAHVLSQGRGNRLLVVKAALAAAGIPSHLVLVRSFGIDPAKVRFPRSELFPWAVLRLELPGGAEWFTSMYRLGPPFGLPPLLRGQDAWVVPEPGEEPVLIKTPEAPAEPEGREVSFELALSADGTASGSGRDRYRGFDAAGLKDALERFDAGQRKQAVEGTLGRGLRGVSLDSLSTEGEGGLGGTASLIYQLHAPLGTQDGPRLLVPGSLVPQRLSRRWVQTADRTLPLLIDAGDLEKTRVELTLPSGLHLAKPAEPVELQTPFGNFSWSAREEGGKLYFDEALSMPLQRIAPAQYPAFAAFARAVDEAQSQELLLAPR